MKPNMTIYFGPPLWIMSPGIRVYKANQVLKLHGYLAKFEPVEMPVEHTEFPLTVTKTITVTMKEIDDGRAR